MRQIRSIILSSNVICLTKWMILKIFINLLLSTKKQMPFLGKKLNFQKKSSELLFLQEIRNETHRFSISKQRKKELKGIVKSSLDSIELVGAERRKALLRFFGSLEQIKKARPKDLMKVRGVGKTTADIIFRNLH